MDFTNLIHVNEDFPNNLYIQLMNEFICLKIYNLNDKNPFNIAYVDVGTAAARHRCLYRSYRRCCCYFYVSAVTANHHHTIVLSAVY